MSISYEVAVITPAMAREMLEHNTGNYRKLSSKSDIYAEEMKKGLWEFNGEAIVFDEDGVLKNGQHRLAAIVKADVPVKMLVIRGISRDVTTWDDGKARTLKERAAARGYSIDHGEGGAIAIIIKGFGSKSSHYGKNEVLDFYEKDGEVMTKARLMCTHGGNPPQMKKSGCIAAVYCAIKLKYLNDVELEAFCEIVNSGKSKGNYLADVPLTLAQAIRSGIKTPSGTVRSFGGATTRKALFEITWRALTAFKEGRKQIRRLKPDDKGNEILEKTRAVLAKEADHTQEIIKEVI